MKSMTGFGYAECSNENYQISLELKGYNNRYLDINLSLPPGLSVLETDVRDFLKAQIVRGRVEVYMRVRELATQTQAYLDRELATQYLQTLKELRKLAGIRKPVGLEHLISLEGIIRTDRQKDPEGVRPLVMQALEQAFAQFDGARVREGALTVSDIEGQLQRIQSGLNSIETLAGTIEETIVEGVRTKFSEILGSQIEENRVLTEAAALVVKHSINEEINRIRTHSSSFIQTLKAGEPAGKKLDFLSQELNREINTIGSKSFLIPVTQEVVTMKDALENIREQLRNLE